MVPPFIESAPRWWIFPSLPFRPLQRVEAGGEEIELPPAVLWCVGHLGQ